MKKKFPIKDARLKIKGNVADARQILTNRKQTSKVTKAPDARYKIRANKFTAAQKNSLFIANITSLKKEVKKRSTIAEVLPGRTINTRLGSVTGVKRPAQLQKPKTNSIVSLSDVSGFISVNKGQRVLMEKVTMHQTGMKIAVRNELASSTLSAKKPDSDNRVTDNTIKITLKNPSARQNTSPHSYRHQRSTRQPVRSRRLPSSRSRANDKPYHRPLHLQRKHSQSPASVASSKTSLPSRPRSESQRDLPQVLTQLQKDGPRPSINSSESTASWTKNTSSDSFQKAEKEEAEVASPFEGTKVLVSNLHPVVVEDDILELFSVLGPVRRARMVDQGKAEVVFVKKDDAITAYQKYNNRDLDGQPMRMKLLLQESSGGKKIKYSWMDEIGDRKKSGKAIEIDSEILQRAIFKGSSSSTSSKPVVFTVKI